MSGLGSFVDGTAAWLLVGLAALIVGFSKTAVGGFAAVAVAIYASVLPTRESTGAVLLVLLIGDAVAIAHYHRHCDWKVIRQLLPGVLPGLVLGAGVLAVIGDDVLRVGIGAIILSLVALQLWLRRPGRVEPSRDADRSGGVGESGGWGRPARVASGVAAGFTTMVANAGGAVMTLYLTAQRIDKLRFLGTATWFFLFVNLAKLPFSIGLGLISMSALVTALMLVPLVVAGGLFGAWVARRMNQRTFEIVVLTATAISGVALLVG